MVPRIARQVPLPDGSLPRASGLPGTPRLRQTAPGHAAYLLFPTIPSRLDPRTGPLLAPPATFDGAPRAALHCINPTFSALHAKTGRTCYESPSQFAISCLLTAPKTGAMMYW